MLGTNKSVGGGGGGGLDGGGGGGGGNGRGATPSPSSKKDSLEKRAAHKRKPSTSDDKEKKKMQKELETALGKQKRELERERKELEKREKELEKKSNKGKKGKKDEDLVSHRSASSSSSPSPYIQSDRRRSGSWIRPRSLMMMKKMSKKGESNNVDSPLAQGSSDSVDLHPQRAVPPGSPHASSSSRSILRSGITSIKAELEGRASDSHLMNLASPRTHMLLDQLKRLKSNDKDLIEFKTPPTTMQELQASTMEFLKIISDCLVFNTHLKRLEISGCEMKEGEAKLLGDALRVNSTLEYLNVTWCNLGDAGAIALASGLSMNEGLKAVDMRHNQITAKGLHAIATFLSVNITLVDLLLSETEVFIDGDDLIFDSESESLADQERRDKAAIEHILLSNRALAKCFSGESRKVDLSRRGMDRVPSLILVIPTIIHLDLSHNQLKHIPRGIRKLARLEHLNLSHNQLEELPLDLGTLHALKHLDVKHNRLSQLPLSLNLLENLEDLDISNNNVPFIPISLGTLPALKELRAFNNPLPYPKKVLSSGAGVISYLRDKNNGSLLCHRIKLMCVGQANVGKTSLVEKLLSKSVTKPTEPESSARAGLHNQGAQGDDEEIGGSKLNDSQRNRRWSYSEVEHGKISLVSAERADGWDGADRTSAKKRGRNGKKIDMATDGIRIRDWTAKSVSRKDLKDKEIERDINSNIITFSTWDFAGQEIYYYTHLFFLSRRGIYLMIFNLLKPEEETSRIEYWLQSIHTRARGAPVVLVGTHLDAKKCTKKYLDHLYANLLQKFSAQFKNIRFFFALSCSTGKGVEDLRKKLVELAQSMIDREGPIPQSYLILEEKIRAIAALEPQPVVNWEIFERLALSSGVQQNLIPKAAKYLHQLGSLVHFTERESGLDDIVILDCQWLTNVFSDVITLKHNFVKDGILQRKNLPQIWKSPSYPESIHDSLVALLEQFEVAYALPPSKSSPDGAILVPCLLSDTRPADLHDPDLWPEEQSELVQLARYYSFEFMPFGFFNRFMVRLLRSGWLLIRCWKNGMLFNKADDKLLLELDAEVAFRLKLSMRGTAPSRQMMVLSAMIDTLIADWLRVEVKVTIPCTHCVNENAQPFLFTLAQLERAISKGRTVVNCRGVDMVDLFALAPDLVMMELNRIIYKSEDLKIIEQPIAITHHTKVSKAQLGNDLLVIKSYSEQYLSASSLAATAASNEFRALVWEISGLEHPNIVPLRGICTDPFCIVSEYVEGPSLAGFLANTSAQRLIPFDWKFRIKVATDVARAMMFLHNITPPLIHGRLKSSNIMLCVETVRQTPVVVARVADFALYWAPIYVENRPDAPYWVAPEVLARQKHTRQSDIYSYGTLLYELFVGEHFFAKQIPESSWSGVEKRVLEGERPVIPSDCYPEFKELIVDCWQANPETRPSFELILKRLSRLAIKYDLPLPGPSGRIALPSYSVRKFSNPFEDDEEEDQMVRRPRVDDVEQTEELADEEKGKEKEEQNQPGPSSMASPSPVQKEENSIKRRLQSTLASLQRELESNEQEAADATPSKQLTTSDENKPAENTSSLPPASLQIQTPSSVATTPITPVLGAKAVTKTLRTSGSGTKDREYINLEGKGSYNSVLQRQVDRLREQVESLQSSLKEAQKARSKAERSLAFQILENDRQHSQIERLKRKVERLKHENDKLTKEASAAAGTGPRIMKSQGRAKQSLKESDKDLTLPEQFTPSTDSVDHDGLPRPTLASSVSEGFQKKRQLAAISTSTRVQRNIFTPYSPPKEEKEIDVQEIQERLRRRSLSKRILDRLAYWESMQQRQVASTSNLASGGSGLGTRGGSMRSLPRATQTGEKSPKGKEKDTEEVPGRMNIPRLDLQSNESRRRVELLSPRSEVARLSPPTDSAELQPRDKAASREDTSSATAAATSSSEEVSSKTNSKEDGGREASDATIAKRKFLQRASSSSNSLARKRLSLSAKSLRDVNKIALGSNSLHSSGASTNLSASGPVSISTDDLGVGGINQIFYGKAELVKLLLELDEFD